MLIYTVSLSLQLPSCVTIHNQCSNIELVSPVYFGNGAVCPKLSGQQIEIGAKMTVHFEINTAQNDFEGALLFKLRRYNSQRNMDTSTTKINENKVMHDHMLAAWKVKGSMYFACVTLVEHTKGLTWNEDKLKEFYYKNCNWLKEYENIISETWFIDDSMHLTTSVDVRGLKRSFELSISISEEMRNGFAMNPLYTGINW
jgi:hypothetical protein